MNDRAQILTMGEQAEYDDDFFSVNLLQSVEKGTGVNGEYCMRFKIKWGGKLWWGVLC
jgi:hypothetical protein